MAVVLVDLSQAYFSSGSPLNTERPEVMDHCRELLAFAREYGVPIWWTRVEIPADSRSVFRRKVPALAAFAPGHPMGEWLPGLRPAAGEGVVTKAGASAFFGTPLAAELETAGVDTLVLGGVSTSGCVRATALDACQHDLIPVVVPELCGDRDAAAHAQALHDLDAKYADVVPLSDVLDAMRRLRPARASLGAD